MVVLKKDPHLFPTQQLLHRRTGEREEAVQAGHGSTAGRFPIIRLHGYQASADSPGVGMRVGRSPLADPKHHRSHPGIPHNAFDLITNTKLGLAFQKRSHVNPTAHPKQNNRLVISIQF